MLHARADPTQYRIGRGAKRCGQCHTVMVASDSIDPTVLVASSAARGPRGAPAPPCLQACADPDQARAHSNAKTGPRTCVAMQPALRVRVGEALLDDQLGDEIGVQGMHDGSFTDTEWTPRALLRAAPRVG